VERVFYPQTLTEMVLIVHTITNNSDFTDSFIPHSKNIFSLLESVAIYILLPPFSIFSVFNFWVIGSVLVLFIPYSFFVSSFFFNSLHPFLFVGKRSRCSCSILSDKSVKSVYQEEKKRLNEKSSKFHKWAGTYQRCPKLTT